MNWRVPTSGLAIQSHICLDWHVPKNEDVHDYHVNPMKRKLSFLLNRDQTLRFYYLAILLVP